MSEHPKSILALQLATASVLGVNSENLSIMRQGLLELHKDFKRLLKEREDASVRHAEEVRELKERFSEVAKAVKAYYDGLAFPMLTPFVTPAPDPLESWLHKSGYEGNSVVEQALADLTKSGGKIVWEAGE